MRLELLLGDDAIFGKRLGRGRRSRRAWSSVACARCSSARARPSAALALSTPASASARVRASSSGGASARTRATTWPRFTRSPGSSSIRSTRPDTGADTTNRSRTRVTPSSSTVTTSGPRETDGDVDLDRRRPQHDGEQAGDDGGRTKNATIGEQAQHRHHSRVLRTATRSRRSSRRLTSRPDTAAAAMTIRNDQAIVAGDVTNDSRYTSLLKAVMMTWPNT